MNIELSQVVMVQETDECMLFWFVFLFNFILACARAYSAQVHTTTSDVKLWYIGTLSTLVHKYNAANEKQELVTLAACDETSVKLMASYCRWFYLSNNFLYSFLSKPQMWTIFTA